MYTYFFFLTIEEVLGELLLKRNQLNYYISTEIYILSMSVGFFLVIFTYYIFNSYYHVSPKAYAKLLYIDIFCYIILNIFRMTSSYLTSLSRV